MSLNDVLHMGLRAAKYFPSMILQGAALLPDLGSSSGIYLCYQGIRGREWTFRKLNCFQRFLRWMGFYFSTHLKTIAGRLSQYPNIPDALRDKIQASWLRAHRSKISEKIYAFS